MKAVEVDLVAAQLEAISSDVFVPILKEGRRLGRKEKAK
jgi:hypothetical protein